MYTVNGLKRQSRINKGLFGLSFILCLIATILCGIYIQEGYKVAIMIFTSAIAVIPLVFLIVYMIQNKIRSFNYLNHKISYYVGAKSVFLFVDDKYVDKNTHSSFTTTILSSKIDNKELRLEFRGFSSIPRVIYDSNPIIDIKHIPEY